MAGIGGVDGLVTGLDTTEIIDKILELDRQPIYDLQARIKRLTNIKSAYETLEANLLALKIDAQRLYRLDRFIGYKVESSNEGIISATASNSAKSGIYTLTVNQLAQNHQISSATFSDPNSTIIGTGSVTIRVGDASPYTINVDSSNNTIESFANAINNAGIGARAVVVNVGGTEPQYKLLISSNETGADQRITIDENLTGGTGLGFGSVSSPVYGTWNGTSEVTSSGTYTGDTDATFTFTVVNGGTVGTDAITLSYTDGGSVSGTITIPSGTEAGTGFDVFGGLKISLGAGAVNSGDTFTVDTTTSTIQAPLNAIVAMGSGAAGTNPIVVENSTNTITSLIPGLTLDLNKADVSSPVTLNEQVDSGDMTQKIQDFVDHFNEVVSFFKDNFSYDKEKGEGGPLFGQNYAMRLSQSIRDQVMGVINGLDQDLDNLSELGIKTLTDGTLSFSQSDVEQKINENPQAVANLFSTSGSTTDSDVKFLFASSATKPSYLLSDDGYDVRITVAASKALLEASSIAAPSESAPLVIDDTNSHFKITLDDKTSADLNIATGSYTSGDDLAAEMERVINADSSLEGSSISVSFVDDGGGNGHFVFKSNTYGSSSVVRFESVDANSIYDSIGITLGTSARGTDVQGTINGEAATGKGQYLTGNDGNEYTDGLQLLVTITPEQLALQGEDQGYVKVSKGVGTRVIEFVNDATDVQSGAITYQKQAIDRQEDSLQDQIDMIEARVAKKRERLVKQFVALESIVAQWQAQEQYLQNAFMNLGGMFGNNKNNNSSSGK